MSKHYKIVLLGPSIGKSCLIHRIVTNKFDQYLCVTIGYEYEVLNQTVDDEQAKFTLFSTGGNERFDVMARRLLADEHCKAAIICVDLQDFRTYEKLNYWLQELKSFEKMRIYFCVLKSDLIDISQQMFGVELLKYRAKECNANVFVTSSKTGEGVQEMVVEITRDLIGES